MANPIISQQVPPDAPRGEQANLATNLLLPPITVQERMQSFPEDVYDTSPGSHLSRFVSALLGDAGAGQLRKRMLLARLASSAEGTLNFDLDRFFGAIFGVGRRTSERVSLNPYSDVATIQEWDNVDRADGSYRSRAGQFAKAIQYGGTTIGIELAAEALLGVDCEVVEAFTLDPYVPSTYDDVEALGTYADVEAEGVYADIESSGVLVTGRDLNLFQLVVKRPITQEERYDLMQVLEKIKPAHTRFEIVDLPIGSYVETPIASIASDSEHWEIRSRTVPKSETEGAYVVPGSPGSPEEQRRPPFSGYQGERWSYVGIISGSVAYRQDAAGQVYPDHFERVIYPTGTRDYPPTLGIKSAQEINSGRVSSDGVFASHFFSGTRTRSQFTYDPASGLGDAIGELDTGSSSSLADAYFDGMSLEEVLRLAPEKLSLLRTQEDSASRFWSSPAAPIFSADWDTLEIQLQEPQRVNFFEFEVPHFPARVEFQYLDESSEWATIYGFDITDSFPAVLSSRVDSIAQVHPQHGVAGHWLPISSKIPPVLSQHFRIRLRRNAAGKPPVSTEGLSLDYSLGVRKFDLGYEISERSDIPVLPSGQYDAVGTSIDILGSRVYYDVVEKKAKSLLQDDDALWVSEPQPVSAAVVNLYLDVRSPAGEAQEIDRFYLDPVYSGPRCNLYFSSDDPADVPFDASDDPIIPNELAGTEILNTSNGMVFARDTWSRFEIDPAAIQWNSTGDWTIALHFEALASSALADLRSLFGFGNTDVVVASNSLSVQTDGLPDMSVSVGFNAGEIVNVTLSHIGGQATLSVRTDAGTTTLEFEGFFGDSVPLRIGANVFSSNFGMVLKNLALFQSGTPISIEEWSSDPSVFTLKSSPGSGVASRTDSAILRYNPALRSVEAPRGFLGGPGSVFEFLTWTPVPRDFVLTKGFMSVPPTLAKWWKFEFSQLVARPYEVFVPMQRRVKLFPPGLASPYARTSSAYEAWPGLETAVEVQLPFADSPSTEAPALPEGYLPTEMIYSSEVDSASRFRRIASTYGFVQWNIDDVPRFVATSRHVYDEISVLHSAKVAFFVGLRRIVAYRSPYLIADDHLSIVDRFWTGDRLASTTWSQSPGLLASENRSLSVATSKVIPTRSRVRAIQFAAQQSPPLQLLADDAFEDQRLGENSWNDPNGWSSYGDAVLRYAASDLSVIIARSASLIASVDALDRGVSNRPVHPVFSVYDESYPTPDVIGGVQSELVTSSPKGQLHAAVRLTAITDIVDTPIMLQIVAANDTILREVPITARAGDTVEVTLSYILGSFNDGLIPAYSPPRTIAAPLPRLTFSDEEALIDLNDDIETAISAGSLYRVRLIQEGASQDAWKVHRLSLFDEGILWEFSANGGESWFPAYGIRNDPYGALSFPIAGDALAWRVTGYRPNLSVTSLQIRPWYLGQDVARVTAAARGGNASVFDSAPPIEQDPEFQAWKGDIPASWYRPKTPYITPVGQPITNAFSQSLVTEVEDDQEISDVVVLTRLTEYLTDEAGDPITTEDGFPIIIDIDPML